MAIQKIACPACGAAANRIDNGYKGGEAFGCSRCDVVTTLLGAPDELERARILDAHEWQWLRELAEDAGAIVAAMDAADAAAMAADMERTIAKLRIAEEACVLAPDTSDEDARIAERKAGWSAER